MVSLDPTGHFSSFMKGNLTNVGLMLARRLRRWASIKQTLAKGNLASTRRSPKTPKTQISLFKRNTTNIRFVY